VALGAVRLRRPWPAALAALAAVTSLATVAPVHHRDALDPLTGEVVAYPGPNTAYDEVLTFDPVGGIRLALILQAVTAGGLAVVLLLRHLRRQAQHAGVRGQGARLGGMAAAVAIVWVVPYVVRALAEVAAGRPGFDLVWNGAWEPLALAGIATLVATAWCLFDVSIRSWAWPESSGDSPGSARIARDLSD
jgi:hypothetical protein